MKPGEVRDKPVPELQRLEAELAEELFHLRLKHATGQLQKTANVRRVRKDLARVKTVLRAKALQAGR